MSKIFWLDTETTGIDPKRCAIVQLAGLVEIGGEIISEIELKICPHKGAFISDEALKVNGLTQEQLDSFPVASGQYLRLIAELNSYIDKYNPSDKFILAGYNVGFDEQFLRNFFYLCGDKFFGSYFAWPKIDVANFVAEEYVKGLRLINFKLETLCKQYNIPLQAHDAAADIKATRDLYYKLKKGTRIS